jgi:hypothetical protein
VVQHYLPDCTGKETSSRISLLDVITCEIQQSSSLENDKCQEKIAHVRLHGLSNCDAGKDEENWRKTKRLLYVMVYMDLNVGYSGHNLSQYLGGINRHDYDSC